MLAWHVLVHVLAVGRSIISGFSQPRGGNVNLAFCPIFSGRSV